MKLLSVTSPETFDVIGDGFHFPLTHAQASVFAFVTGPGIIVSAADRATILGLIDANKPSSGPTGNLDPITQAITALATAYGTDTASILEAVSGIPAATVKAQGAALSNG